MRKATRNPENRQGKRITRQIVSVIMAIVTLLAVFAAPTAAKAVEKNYMYIRVKLSIGSLTSITMLVTGKYHVNSSISFEDGTLTASVYSGQVKLVHNKKGTLFTGKSITVTRDNMLPDAGCMTFNNRSYLGSFTISVNESGKLQIVNNVPMAHYLYGVVGAEMSEYYPLEALKAQAVSAKCYAYSFIKGTGDYDLGDTSKYQVYVGIKPEFEKVITAVDSTIASFLTVDGNIIKAFYSASNGGETMLPSYLWNGSSLDKGYAVSIDSYDFENKSCKREDIAFPIGDAGACEPKLRALLEKKAAQAMELDSVSLVEIISAETNTPKKEGLLRHMTQCSVKLSALAEGAQEPCKLTLTFPCSDFKSEGVVTQSLSTYWGEKTANNTYTVHYVGWGHGVGLSQRGAQARANAGHSFSKILGFYFPNAELKTRDVHVPDASSSVRNPMDAMQNPPTGGAVKLERDKMPDKTKKVDTAKLPANEATACMEPIYFGYVNEDGAILRERPSSGAKKLLTLKADTPVTIYAMSSGDFLYVEIKEKFGYIDEDSVTLTENYAPKLDFSSDVYYIGYAQSGEADMHSKPSADSLVKKSIGKGVEVYVLNQVGNFYLVQHGFDIGYVQGSFIAVNSTSPMPSGNVVALGETTESVNFREGPATSYDKLATLKGGEKLLVITKSGGWYNVLCCGVMGYISGEYVRILDCVPGAAIDFSDAGSFVYGDYYQLATINAKSVNLRQLPSTTSSSLEKLDKDAPIYVFGKTGDWYFVQHGINYGYVYAQYVEIGEKQSVNSSRVMGIGTMRTQTGLKQTSSTSAATLMTLEKGASVMVSKLSGNWYIAVCDGVWGYLPASAVTLGTVMPKRI